MGMVREDILSTMYDKQLLKELKRDLLIQQM